MPRFPILAIMTLVTLSPGRAETPTADDHMTKAQARERLAACGTEWQQMKRNGAEGSLIWREFSKTCMARRATEASKADAMKADPVKSDPAKAGARKNQP